MVYTITENIKIGLKNLFVCINHDETFLSFSSKFFGFLNLVIFNSHLAFELISHGSRKNKKSIKFYLTFAACRHKL